MSTLKDIAAHVGISISATSMALRDHRSISRETKRRVWAAQQKLGYKMPLRPPNALFDKKSETSVTVRDIVFLLIDRQFDNPAYGRTFQRVADEAASRQWRPMYLSASLQKLREGRIPSLLKNGGIDGIVVSGAYDELAHQHLRKLGIPLVVMGRYRLGEDPWMSCEQDFSHGIQLFVNRLTAFGHKTFGLFLEDPRSEYAHHLQTHYLRDLSEKGLALAGVASAQGEQADGYLTMDHLLSRAPTAVLLEREPLATKAYEACEKIGLKIPRDISLATFGGSGSLLMKPSLVGIAPHGSEAEVIEKLGRLMEDPDTTPTRELFPMRFIPGGSIGLSPQSKKAKPV